jgi:hypothetical protein
MMQVGKVTLKKGDLFLLLHPPKKKSRAALHLTKGQSSKAAWNITTLNHFFETKSQLKATQRTVKSQKRRVTVAQTGAGT